MRGFLKNIFATILLLLALSVVVSSIYSTHTKQKNSSSVEATQKKKGNNKETVSAAQDIVALIPFIHFDLAKDFYLIRVFKFPLERSISYFNNSELPFTIKYFKALFCFVISPNAP